MRSSHLLRLSFSLSHSRLSRPASRKTNSSLTYSTRFFKRILCDTPVPSNPFSRARVSFSFCFSFCFLTFVPFWFLSLIPSSLQSSSPTFLRARRADPRLEPLMACTQFSRVDLCFFLSSFSFRHFLDFLSSHLLHGASGMGDLPPWTCLHSRI
ncbi:hypothetical protein F5148DRAFT_410740 [Russula earlei]|uniref:Uncharacterized protein n=1 Tax=Russula earlei TaxID=71964 RepID=A0ACC0U170_9AGAM|nr:hypothetical protein F5148DRAFT_410740 [Russula earlei]